MRRNKKGVHQIIRNFTGGNGAGNSEAYKNHLYVSENQFEEPGSGTKKFENKNYYEGSSCTKIEAASNFVIS